MGRDGDRQHATGDPARATTRSITSLSSALDDEIIAELVGRLEPVVFLDYDGTLTPIVSHPRDATMPPGSRDVLEALAHRCTVGIISGRDLADVIEMVGTTDLWYAGSHGLDVRAPDGRRIDFEEGRDLLPELDAAETELAEQVDAVPGAWVERKRFAVAVHYRQTPDEHIDELAEMVDAVRASHPGLRVTGGKRIFELRPDIEWDKGRALRWVLETTGLDRPGTLPIYVGDDVTDEDAFAELRTREHGIGIVVGEEDRDTAAHHRLADPTEVRTFLERLSARLDGEPRS